MASTYPKYIELVDKENTQQGCFITKRDKTNAEEPKKTVLGETSQPKVIADEPSSPEDTKLLYRKR
jgi:hypothetical protein